MKINGALTSTASLSGKSAPVTPPGPALPTRQPSPSAAEPGHRPSTATTPDGHPLEESPDLQELAIESITADASLQTRAKLDEETIGDYAEQMETGTTFPPVTVFDDGSGARWLSDGFHRLAAARKARCTTIKAEVKAGTRLDALRHGLGANNHQSLRRTNADKRHAVRVALKEFKDLSDRSIAELCGVGNQLVGDVRSELCESHSSGTSRLGLDNKRRRVKAAPASGSPVGDDAFVNETPMALADPAGGVKPGANLSVAAGERASGLTAKVAETVPAAGPVALPRERASVAALTPGTQFLLADGNAMTAAIAEDDPVLAADEVRQALLSVKPPGGSAGSADAGRVGLYQRGVVLMAELLNAQARALPDVSAQQLSYALGNAVSVIQPLLKK